MKLTEETGLLPVKLSKEVGFIQYSCTKEVSLANHSRDSLCRKLVLRP